MWEEGGGNGGVAGTFKHTHTQTLSKEKKNTLLVVFYLLYLDLSAENFSAHRSKEKACG